MLDNALRDDGRADRVRPVHADPENSGKLTDELVATSEWSDELVAAAGIDIVDAPFVTVGGGMGSFAMADYLRIAGVPARDIRVLTTLDTPWENYAYLTGVSQLPPEYRIRSDSSSMPDNIWGFPSYAVQSAFSARTLRGFVAPIWNVFTENLLSDYWTPLAGQVFRGLEREADRIGYWGCVEHGQVRMVRRRAGGGYFSVLTQERGTHRRVAFRSRFVHLAVGYPSIRFLPELQDYRMRTGDASRFVNAYEPHEHVYDQLVTRPGTVLVRGGGIAASAILHRLMRDREKLGARTRVLHAVRTYVDGPAGPSSFMRRRGGRGWAHQGFNWPKACWGGQLKARLEKLEGEERRRLWELMGGSTTPVRRGWQRELARGREQGYYTTFGGELDHVDPAPEGGLTAYFKPGAAVSAGPIGVDFVIDATGLVGSVTEHRVLSDLLIHSGADRNVLGRIDVAPTFEVRGARTDGGRLYAAGAAVEGSHYAPVDSLLGLQYAAQRVCDDLAAQGYCRRIGPARSVRQWWKWMRNRTP